MTTCARPIVLCFSGSDSFGAAGSQADLRTISSHGCHAVQIMTAVTAQSPDQCRSSFPLPEQILTDQLLAIKDGPAPAVIKVGMTGGRTALSTIQTAAEQFGVPVILDPVMFASSGRALSGNLKADDFFSLARVCNLTITPNVPEAESLTGVAIRDVTDLPRAAAAILERGVRQVVIKGGHLPASNFVCDYYADRSGLRFFLRSRRSAVTKLRGTGCTFASAMASLIASGHEPPDAAVLAKGYLNQCFAQAFSCGSEASFIDHHTPQLVSEFLPEALPHQHDSLPNLDTTPEASPAHKTGFYVIADSADWVERLVAWGVPTIQLRVKNLAGEALKTEIRRAVNSARGSGSALYINDYWREAVSAGAFGVHLGQEDLADADLNVIRSAGLRLGISTHSWYEAAVAASCKPSYIALGPIFPTTCKSMRFGPQGFTKLKLWKQAWDFPVVAIGGLTLRHAETLRAIGCDGAAVISDVLQNPDPAARTAAWLDSFTDRQDF